MRMISHHVLTLASAALFYGVAIGQDATSAHSAPETQLRSGDVRASNLLGATVKRLTGDTVGQVEDLIVSGDAELRLAVFSIGGVLGVGGKTIALPFKQFQVAPDGATLYLTLSEEELSARPAFDLETVTANNGATTEPAAPEPQTLPDASSPGFVPSGTIHESVAQEDAPQTTPEVASPAPDVAPPAPETTQPGPEVAQEAPVFAPQPQPPELAPQPEPAQTKASNQPASALIGAEVVDPQQSTIGKINDVVVTAEPTEVQVIVQLDESLAGDSRLVAVPLPELTISRGGTGEPDRAVDRVETELTIAQLEALPEFQY